MKKILPAIFFALTLLTASAAEPPRLSFDRPSKPGAYFNAEISLTAVREYTIALPGPDKPVERRESLNATLFADIKVLEVNETSESQNGSCRSAREKNAVYRFRNRSRTGTIRSGSAECGVPPGVGRFSEGHIGSFCSVDTGL